MAVCFSVWYLLVSLYFQMYFPCVKVAVFWQKLKISVNTKYCNCVGELISEFSLPKLGGTYRIINNIFQQLRSFHTLI